MTRPAKNSPALPPSKPGIWKELHDLGLVVSTLQNQLKELTTMYQGCAQVINALSDIVGSAEVLAKIKEIQIKNVDQQGEDNVASVEKAVEAGALKTAETVKSDQDPLLCITQTNSTGEVMHPVKSVSKLSQFLPEVRDQLVGLSVGSEVEIAADQSKVKILNIWVENFPVTLPPVAIDPATTTTSVQTEPEPFATSGLVESNPSDANLLKSEDTATVA